MSKREKMSGGAIAFLRASRLPVGFRFVAEYIDQQTNEKYGNLEYRFKANETTIVLNGAGQLNHAMAQAVAGDRIEVIYKGKETISSGKRKGTEAHQFEVYRVDEETPIFFEAPPQPEEKSGAAAASKEETKNKIEQFKNAKKAAG